MRGVMTFEAAIVALKSAFSPHVDQPICQLLQEKRRRISSLTSQRAIYGVSQHTPPLTPFPVLSQGS
ncbi:hypothetical protein BDR22DRAFT_849579 [Usnea florida]